MARRGIPLLLLIGLTACSGVSSGPVADSVPLEGHILFTRGGTTGIDVQAIFTADADGQHERRLTDLGQYCCLLRLSPDHNRILVMTGADPQPTPVTGGTINIDGSGFQRLRLTNPRLNLVPQAWSPDGTRIAFEGWVDGSAADTGVYTARAFDGGGLVRVTMPRGLPHDIPLDYSPDGKQLVFYRAVAAEPSPTDLGGSLWVVNVDGSDPKIIQTGANPPAPWARWSPDGSRIVFATQRTARRGALWTVQSDGSMPTKIFEDREGRFPIDPAWSPDAQHVLFALDPTNDRFTHPANGLYVIKADGTGLTLVSGTDDFKSQPEWWK